MTEKTLEQIYSEGFFRRRDKYHWRGPIVSAVLQYMYHPTSYIDVGCATGDVVASMERLGIDAWGLEGPTTCVPYLVCDQGKVLIHDLTVPLTQMGDIQMAKIEGRKKFDLCTCWEVAEHLAPEAALTFVQTLCFFSNHILMSACPPSGRKGSGSVHHVNEQPPVYWVQLFDSQGYDRKPRNEDYFRAMTAPWRHKYGVKAWWENVIAFEKRKA